MAAAADPWAQFPDAPAGTAAAPAADPWAQFPDAPKPAPETSMDYSEGIARSGAQGATFGFGDELAAALGSAGNKAVRALGITHTLDGGDIPVRTYDDILAEVRGKDKQFRGEHPYVSLGAEVAGGLGTMAVPARAVAAAPALLTRVGRASAAGAGIGATSGFGNAEGGLENRAEGAKGAGLAGAIAGPVISEVAAPAIIRTGAGMRQALRYAGRELAGARDPEAAAVRNLADRMVQSGVDPAALRAQISPPPSAQLQGRMTPAGVPFNDEHMADIVSRSMRGEPAAQIAQDYGLSPGTVTRYANTYRDNNPTPLNLMDLTKEQAGEGRAGPVMRLGRAAHALSGDESSVASQRLLDRQEGQPGRVNNIISRSVAGGDYEATRTAGVRNLADEMEHSYGQFYAEPDLATHQLGDLMEDPLFRRANSQAQRQARVETIRSNQAAARTGGAQEPVPAVDANNEVFSPRMLDNIQRQLRITAQGAVGNPNNARHAENLRQVFLDRIEDHYPSFRPIRQRYAEGMGQFGPEGALEAGANLTTRLGATSREALRDFDGMTPAQQELYRLGFARNLMDKAANPQIGGAVANQFNTPAVREIVERLYPRADGQLFAQGQRLLRGLRREAGTTGTKNYITAGSQTAEKSSDMGRLMEGAQAAADLATGRWSKLLGNLSTRLTTQLGRRGAAETINLMTMTEPAELLPVLNRLAAAARTTQERQAYVAAIRGVRSGIMPAVSGQTASSIARYRAMHP